MSGAPGLPIVGLLGHTELHASIGEGSSVIPRGVSMHLSFNRV